MLKEIWGVDDERKFDEERALYYEHYAGLAAVESSAATASGDLHLAHFKLRASGNYLRLGYRHNSRAGSALARSALDDARRALERAASEYAAAVGEIPRTVEYFMWSRL